MKRSALQFFACPFCGGDLKIDKANYELSQSSPNAPVQSNQSQMLQLENEIVTGEMSCTACQAGFSIHAGIPRFVQRQLAGKTDINTGDRFAEGWKRFSRLHEKYAEQFFDWMAPVDAAFVRNKVALDAGCGKGRHAFIVANAGAQAVVGVDIGEAIEVAYKNVGHLANVHLAQADIKLLPLKPVIDYAFTNGVLQHMNDPAAGFASIRSKLKPNGAISVWVYGAENNEWIIKFVNPLRIAITSKLPAALLSPLSYLLAILVDVAAHVMLTWTKLQQRYAFLPNLFYQDYLAYIARFDVTEIHHIVFDHLIAPVAYYLPKAEVEGWFRANGFTNWVVRWHNQNSWAGFGVLSETSGVEQQKHE